MNWTTIRNNWEAFFFHNPWRTLVIIFLVLMLFQPIRDYVLCCAIVLGRIAVIIALIWWGFKLAVKEIKKKP